MKSSPYSRLHTSSDWTTPSFSKNPRQTVKLPADRIPIARMSVPVATGCQNATSLFLCNTRRCLVAAQPTKHLCLLLPQPTIPTAFSTPLNLLFLLLLLLLLLLFPAPLLYLHLHLAHLSPLAWHLSCSLISWALLPATTDSKLGVCGDSGGVHSRSSAVGGRGRGRDGGSFDARSELAQRGEGRRVCVLWLWLSALRLDEILIPRERGRRGERESGFRFGICGETRGLLACFE